MVGILALLILIQSVSAVWLIFAGAQILIDLAKALAEFATEMAQRYFIASIMTQVIYSPLMKAVDDLPKLILLNPDIMVEGEGGFVRNPLVENMVNFMLTIIVPFYIFGIASTSFYLMFVSGSPMGRARAKSGLLKLLVSIPLALGSIEIVQFFIDISEYLTAFILSSTNLEFGLQMLKANIAFFRANLYTWVGFGWWPAMRHFSNVLMMGGPIFVAIFMRYFSIILMTIMFPLTIFMYAFRYSQKMGSALFKLTFWWIFSQVMMAIILVGISIASLSLPTLEGVSSNTMLQGLFGMGGFVALAVAPLMTMMIVTWGEFTGAAQDLFYTPWVSLAASTIGLDVETIGKEEVSPPPPIGPPRIPPRNK